MGEISCGGSREGQEEIERQMQHVNFAGRYEMTAAAKCNRPHCGASLRVNAVRKAEASGQGECFIALKVAANVIAEAGILSRDDDGLKRRLAPSSMQTARARDQPLRAM
jgi:hypothetical protein